MKIHGIKKDSGPLLWLRCKKHYCPVCNSELTITEVSKVVNSKSEEAKNYDFSNVDTSLVGNVKFIYPELLCTECGRQYSVEEIKTYENKNK